VTPATTSDINDDINSMTARNGRKASNNRTADRVGTPAKSRNAYLGSESSNSVQGGKLQQGHR
jgi:hypothetical protein